jgi:hypothetical protein
MSRCRIFNALFPESAELRQYAMTAATPEGAV